MLLFLWFTLLFTIICTALYILYLLLHASLFILCTINITLHNYLISLVYILYIIHYLFYMHYLMIFMIITQLILMHYLLIAFYIVLTCTIFISSSIYIIYYCLEIQWMLLLVFFIIGTSIYRGLLNYLILNGWLSILLIIGILLSNSIFLILAIYGKIGYYPFFLLISFIYYCSSYLFIIFDLINKLSYFTSFIMILNISIFISNFDLWLLLTNFIISIFFIKLIISIKHTIFISSFILFLLIYYLLFLQDFLYIFTILLFYLLFNINIIIYLLIFETSSLFSNIVWIKIGFQLIEMGNCAVGSTAMNNAAPCTASSALHKHLPFILIDLYNMKHYTQLSYMLVLFNWLTVFAFYPFILLISKFIGFILILYQSFNLFICLSIFLVFIYQSLIIRILYTLLLIP